MKLENTKLFALAIVGGLFLTSCGNGENSEGHNSHDNMEHEQHEGIEHDHKNHQHGDMNERNVSSNMSELKGDLAPVLSKYFSMNESLVKDDASSAAKSSEKLVQALIAFKGVGLSAEEQKEVDEILESAIENSEHITESATDIGHQREHLISLSTDVKDLIAIIGTSQKLYEDFCPMANNHEGAIWISQIEEISNPYMGSSMPKCGKINRVIE
ncbi:MAG: hypothetical protein CL840_18785 [Crocinitomicaceae bacterium]|nr:hypothetical protein [Crocinitomicaceae bacterium]|tara:strand:+ start:9660 stop:10301 length:642 start_codon:yes stop_codon:yes gene_type:complete